jgi:hypothetical protein
MAFGVGSLDVSDSLFTANYAHGGTGGAGGNGGNALGGGIYSARSTSAAVVTISDTTVVANQVTSGAGVVSGSALGGGIYNGDPSGSNVPVATLIRSVVTANEADGGAGQGIGGGIYNLGSFFIDQFSPVHGNKASTSDDDVFGFLTPL